MVSSTLSRRRCQPSRFARLHYGVDMSKQLITICFTTVTASTHGMSKPDWNSRTIV